MTSPTLRGPAALHLDFPWGAAQPALWRWVLAAVGVITSLALVLIAPQRPATRRGASA